MQRETRTARARDLRVRQTSPEKLLWGELRDRRLGGFKFKRQVPRGPYVVDFLCAETKLIVELDGGVHRIMEVAIRDQLRTDYLEQHGYRVLRFGNAEVLSRIDRVRDAILAACVGEAPHPALSP